jgi:hypothetical protein
MVDQANAYNSWWQFRADSWSRLEEATARIVSSLRRSRPIEDDMTDAVHAGVRGIGAAGAVLGLSRPRCLWCCPGVGCRRELGATGTTGGPDQPRAGHGVLPGRFSR